MKFGVEDDPARWGRQLKRRSEAQKNDPCPARQESFGSTKRSWRESRRLSHHSRSWLRNRSSLRSKPGRSSGDDGTSGPGSPGRSSGACSTVHSTNRSCNRLRNHSSAQRRRSSARQRSWPLRHSHSWLRNHSSIRSSTARSSNCSGGTSDPGSSHGRNRNHSYRSSAHNSRSHGRPASRNRPKRCWRC